MKYKIENKLQDLYGLEDSQAVMLWKDGRYVDVLQSKIDMAKALQKKLMEVPMLKRDTPRINRIGKSIVHNLKLLKEVRK